MIKLSKLDEPLVLADNKENWTKALLDKIHAGLEPTQTERNRYRHPDIKAKLVEETSGKCAYCESKLQHIAYGDIEHISPKSFSPEISFDWNNLTLACDICNTNKGNKFKNGEGLIDPYATEPEERFMVHGPLILGRPGDDDARLTEEALDLNRASLVERRKEKIKYLRDQLEVVTRAPIPLRQILKDNLLKEITQDKEYSAVAKAFLRSSPQP